MGRKVANECRHRAEECSQLARRTRGALQETWLEIARQRLRLAEDAEQRSCVTQTLSGRIERTDRERRG